MSDDTDSNNTGSNIRYLHPDRPEGDVPPAPDLSDFFFTEPSGDSGGSSAPPESPEETTMELPVIPAAPSPEAAMAEVGISPPPDSPDSESGESDDGETEKRSLAERLGDWIEYRIALGQARLEVEKPLHEAEIADKVARLKSRTGNELALAEQNNKLRQAHLKARADRAKSHGKADASESSARGGYFGGGRRGRGSASGMGADKGGTKQPGAGGYGGYRNGSGRHRPGTRSSNSSGPYGSYGGRNGPGGAPGSRTGGARGKETPGGSRGRQNGPGGSGGWGRGGHHRSEGYSPATERAHGRQQRAAARQAARLERRRAAHDATLADRTRDRDQNRGRKDAERERRRQERDARSSAKRARREAANADRTTFGQAVAEGAQQRWDKRRKTGKDSGTGTAAPKDASSKTGKAGGNGPDAKDSAGGSLPKVNLGKDKKPKVNLSKDKEAKKDSGPKAGDPKSSRPADTETKTKKPGGESKPGGATKRGGKSKAGGSTRDGRRSKSRRRSSGAGTRKSRFRDRFGRQDQPRSGHADSGAKEPRGGPVRAEDLGFSFDRPDRPQQRGQGDEKPRGIAPGPHSLGPAPEPHTQRPGTSRPAAEHPVGTEASNPATGGSHSSSAQESTVKPAVQAARSAVGRRGMARQHRTDITFEQYLVEMANIAVAAGVDKDRAEELAGALEKVADALRDMAFDLADDHNITAEVTSELMDLADAAARMKQQANRCATECGTAALAALITADAVARVYRQDMDAMDEAGLQQASAAAHHD